MTKRRQQLHNWLRSIFEANTYTLQPCANDASFRQYFRLSYKAQSFIVMDAPPTQENCQTFIEISRRLVAAGINAPRVLNQDLAAGFLLLNDLGTRLYLDELSAAKADSLYADAMEALVKMQSQIETDKLPIYAASLLAREMELFRTWLLKKHLGLKLSAAENRMLDDVFQLLIDAALSQPTVFVHRDYHSRNLVVSPSDNPSDNPSNNPGVLDFQDAVLGPFTYDLVSLLKDCYIRWPKEQLEQWALLFFEKINPYHPEVDAATFLQWFDLMGVQRHLKAAGIFARLYHRDGKANYLGDIPRTLAYILALEPASYPEIQDLASLIRAQVAPALTEINQSCKR